MKTYPTMEVHSFGLTPLDPNDATDVEVLAKATAEGKTVSGKFTYNAGIATLNPRTVVNDWKTVYVTS